MAIQFVVEDGTGLTNSTSYVSVAEFIQYWENRGTTYSSESSIQKWLIEDTAYADLTYCWGGNIADDDQALDVPRVGWADVYGRDLDDSVPTYLKNGVCELAAARQGADPESSSDVGVASETYGPVSVSYRSGTNGQTVTYPTAVKWFGKMLLCRGLRNWPS